VRDNSALQGARRGITTILVNESVDTNDHVTFVDGSTANLLMVTYTRYFAITGDVMERPSKQNPL